MSKELTEKFMNDELDDSLYYFTQKMLQDNVEIGHSFAFNMVRADDGEYLDWFLIHEVLAPVPTYEEYLKLESDSLAKQEGVELVAELEQKVHILNEANMTLENAIGSQADYFRQQISVLESQLSEANEVIANFRTYDFTRDDELAEEYQVKYGISGNKIYTNRKPSKEFE